jgi:hypothetical protein
LQRIGDRAFSDAPFEKLRIPCFVEVIESFAFADCGSLCRLEFESESLLQRTESSASHSTALRETFFRIHFVF